MQNNPNINSSSNINIDDLVKQIYTRYPNLSADNKEADEALRKKLHLQFIVAVPQVKLKHQDLKCIIMNVKKSLCEFQKRIDESVAQQQLRRTTRVRRTINQDPQVIDFFNHGHKYEKASTSPTCTNKSCHQVSDLGELVQVESLPVSASTNLLTIFVPSILQEQLHSCKYKISIDLNRMDLTKKIIDLNLEQQANSSLETKEGTLKAIDKKKDDEEHKVTYEISGNTVTNNTMRVIETQITSPKIELKLSPNTASSSPSLESTVSIETDAALPKKKRGAKRKDPKPPSTNPPKKRGRKLGSKNKKKNEKSEIAKYVEMFACNATSPTNVSQVVTSTTQNWDDLPDHGGQIAYFMNGEWTTLAAPINACNQLPSTTNGTVMNLEETAGSETFIPFEDFVNYIDNPSIDVGNNVIARVLAGSVDAPPDNTNPLDSNVLTMCAGTSQTAASNENLNAIQNKLCTSKALDMDIVHSAVVTKKTNTSCRALDLSRDFDISFNVNVLDLTQKQAKNTTSTLEKEVHPCNREDNSAEKTVVFSTIRSMPLLDDMEGDIFTSTTVGRSEDLEKRVVFSMAPNESPASNKGSPDGDSVTDSAIEMDRRDTADYTLNTQKLKASKDKTKAEVIKGMSLLEIENDIDDSLLDFDNCLDDDLLSLAPSSCFNSPNEDRFSESQFMDIDEDKCSTIIERAKSSAAPAGRSQHESSSAKLNEDELNPPPKTFKIPRVKQIADEPSRELPPAKIPTATQQELNNTENANVCPGGGLKPVFTISSPSTNTTESIAAASASPQIVSIREIPKIFGSLCFDFLADNCFEGTCKFSHQLLEHNVMITSLSLLRNDVLHCAYRFIWRHYKLFRFYFPIFCDEYARRNLRRKLANMVSDCQMQPACLVFLRKIHSALISSGLNKINACRFVLNRVKERSQVAIDVLLEIIVDSDASMFTAAIEQFSQTSDYKFRMTDINQLASACLRSSSAELITVLIKCLIGVDQAEFATMRSPELIQLLEMIKSGGIDGL